MAEGVRLGELLLALSVAIDLGLGLPMETIMRTALVARRLVARGGLIALPSLGGVALVSGTAAALRVSPRQPASAVSVQHRFSVVSQFEIPPG